MDSKRTIRRGPIRRGTVLALLGLLPAVTPLRDFLGAEPGSIWGANLLENGSLEEGDDLPRDWSKQVSATSGGGPGKSKVVVDGAEAKSGKRSIRLAVADTDGTFYSLNSDPVEVQEGIRYRLSGWIKIRGVRRVRGQYLNCNLFVSFSDRGGRVIRVGGYPVLATRAVTGTSNWAPVERIVRAPENAAVAVVGCFLSCSGEVWFDDVSLAAQKVAWKRKTSGRFVYFYEKSDRPQARALSGNDRNLGKLEELLGLKYPKKIRYYKYISNERKGLITGNAGNAHVEGPEIHTIFWSDRHEVIHVLLNHSLGPTIALLGEGIAVYLSGSWQRKKVHAVARDLLAKNELIPIESIVDTHRFRAQPDAVTYPEAGSFVGYLVERYGIENLKKIYPYPSSRTTAQQFAGRLENVYKKNLRELEREWHRSLRR